MRPVERAEHQLARAGVHGLLAEDPVAWARGKNAELVDFHAARGGRLTPSAWLEAVAAIEGRPPRDAAALVDAVLRRSGLSSLSKSSIAGLPPFARAALAVAEVAIAIAGAAEPPDVVVPEPPLSAPHRHELRRLACELLRGATVWLHARDAQELAALLPREAILDAAAGVRHPGTRAVLVRVYGWGEPYEAFRKGLDHAGVVIGGGPIAHVLTVPDGFGPREVLALAFEAGLDVLEVRETA